MFQQIAWNLANTGDFAQSRQVAEEQISDPDIRSQTLQQGLRQPDSAALQKGLCRAKIHQQLRKTQGAVYQGETRR